LRGDQRAGQGEEEGGRHAQGDLEGAASRVKGRRGYASGTNARAAHAASVCVQQVARRVWKVCTAGANVVRL
jgi:hypothetical protein